MVEVRSELHVVVSLDPGEVFRGRNRVRYDEGNPPGPADPMDRIERLLEQAAGDRIAQIAVPKSVKVIPVFILALDAGGDICPVESGTELVHRGGTERAQVCDLHILIEAVGIRLPALPEAIDVGFAIENG